MKKKSTTKLSSVNDPRLLNDISQMILSKGNLKSTSSNILTLLSQKVDSLFYIFFLVENDNLILQSYATGAMNILSKIIKFDVFKISYPLSVKEMLISRCVNEKRIVKSARLRDFFAPVFKPAVLLDTIQQLTGIKQCVGIPIVHNGKAIGAIGFASKKKELTEDELNTLQLYANLSGIAVNNSHQFEQIQKQYEMEKTTTSMLGHELKTPIAIAHNDAQLIANFLTKTPKSLDDRTHRELRTKVKDIKDNIDRVTKICNSIFSLREVESHIPEDIHQLKLDQQMEPIIANFRNKAEDRGLRFMTNIKTKPGKYYAGIIQLEQIICILLDNAIKYTEKGEITLETTIINMKLVVTVTDTGCGIPKSQYEKIFDQFYRYHKGIMQRKRGLGLGLYIAKKIVMKLKGSISVEGNPSGKGTRFTVKIPVYGPSRKLAKIAL